LSYTTATVIISNNKEIGEVSIKSAKLDLLMVDLGHKYDTSDI